MTRKSDTARRKNDELPPASTAQRIGWIALSLVWLFVVVSLVSFDSGDPPSHAVSPHNDPVANLCGMFGAAVAYYSYHVVGVGIWVLVAAVAAFLAITVTGRVVTHPLVRVVGLLLMAGAVSTIHGLLLPTTGPLPGSHAGLISVIGVGELAPRFSTVGTFLILAATFAVGAVVAVDRLAIEIPRRMLATLGIVRHVRLPRRAAAPAKAKKAAQRSRRTDDQPIDPDAGGLGGTEAFDPDEYELEDGEEEELEDGEEWVYEDVDEDEDEDEEDPDAEYEEDDEEWEYEDEEEDEDVEEEESQRVPLSAAELREKIAKLPVRMTSIRKKVARDEDIPREENFEGYLFPTLELLEDPDTNYSQKMEGEVRKQAESLEEALQTFQIDGEVVGIDSGPTVTLYSIQLAPGTKVSKVSAVASDLARAVRAQNIRIVPNMAGKTSIGIEVPNLHKEKVRLKELMSSGEAAGMRLPMFLGKDSSGEPLVADLTSMPHMLIAGTTGSGKSVCMNTIIMSWLYTKRPDELKLVLVDPKMVEMSQFSDIPHLMCPVVTEMGRAAGILEWAVTKMEERYELLREAQVRDIASYNSLNEEELYELFQPTSDLERAKIPKKLPYMVFVIDELADLMLTNREVESSIVRIAQKARAVGIHLILATQRPQANVVTGLIKSNMPCRCSFKVASGMDSRIVLDSKGAELLLGQGDMMLLTPHSSEIKRSQGTLVTDMEIRRVAKFLKEVAAPTFERSLMAIRPGHDDEEGGGLDSSERDPMFEKAVEVMIETGRGSVSLLQRRLAVGYSRASRLVDQMFMAGILGDHKGSVAREVMITLEDWQRMQAMEDGEDDAEGMVIETMDSEATAPDTVRVPDER